MRGTRLSAITVAWLATAPIPGQESGRTGSGGSEADPAFSELGSVLEVPADPPRGVLDDSLIWRGNTTTLSIGAESQSVPDLGRGRVLEFESDYEGRLFLSAEHVPDLEGERDEGARLPSGVAPWLRILDLDGRVVARSDDAAGHDSAALILQVQEGDLFDIQVGLRADGDSPGRVKLRVFEAEESEQSRDLADQLAQAREQAEAKLRAGDRHGAREVIRAVVVPWFPLTADLARSRDVAFESHLLARVCVQVHDVPLERALWAAAREFGERAFPRQSEDLQTTRLNLAVNMGEMGEWEGAHALLTQVIGVLSRTHPAEHPMLQLARANLAFALKELGDLEAARLLQEQILEESERSLGEDDLSLQAARGNLAVTMALMGDFAGARALEEQVLAALMRTAGEDSLDLQIARLSLSHTLKDLGELEEAGALQELAVASCEGFLPEDSTWLQIARSDLALTRGALGDWEGARSMLETTLATCERALSDSHTVTQTARGALAIVLAELGDRRGAYELESEVLSVRRRTLPGDHPFLSVARLSVARTASQLGEREEARQLTREVAEGVVNLVSRDRALSRRAREMLALKQQQEVNWCLSWAAVDPTCLDISQQWELVESVRGVGASREWMLRQVAFLPEVQQRRHALQTEIAALEAKLRRTALRREQDASASPSEDQADPGFDALLRQKEKLEAAGSELLAREAREQGVFLDASAESIARSLPPGAAAVGFWKYDRELVNPETGEGGFAVPSFVAFVLRRNQLPRRVELGAQREVTRALEEWRQAVGVKAFPLDPVGRGRSRGGELLSQTASGAGPDETTAGHALRRLVFDPLRGELGDARHVVLALDGVLHLVPFGALPGDEGAAEVGVLADHFDFEVRGTLKELTVAVRPELRTPSILAMGGVDYDAEPRAGSLPDFWVSREGDRPLALGKEARFRSRGAPISEPRQPGRRDRANLDFQHLPGTRGEARGVVDLFRSCFSVEEHETALLMDSRATCEALIALSPRARFIHLATHGYVEDESIPTFARSRGDPASSPVSDRRALVVGLSPMTISGLALAGANLRETDTGEPRGVLTASELSSLDLSGCELVVLSACGSHAGLERSGQGLASLQQAVYVAGAQMSLSSLWRVPDEATRVLMERFYEQWWKKGQEPRRALEEAQRWMREQKTPGDAKPLYRVRDWGGWVLAGREQ